MTNLTNAQRSAAMRARNLMARFIGDPETGPLDREAARELLNLPDASLATFWSAIEYAVEKAGDRAGDHGRNSQIKSSAR